MNRTVRTTVSAELKNDAERVFRAMGLKTSASIRLFLQQSVNVGGLPFRPTTARPNAETMAAMNETETDENLSSYNSFGCLRKKLDV